MRMEHNPVGLASVWRGEKRDVPELKEVRSMIH